MIMTMTSGFRAESNMSTHDLLATFREAIQTESISAAIVVATHVREILEQRATQQAMEAVEEVSLWLD
tara:strand:+ start:368 stop:571 length:204 start_codon:yes stop_codon:yes gene_type:complete